MGLPETREGHGTVAVTDLIQDLRSLILESHEAVALLRLDEAGIRVAEYLTGLPPRDVLAKKLQAAVAHARAAMDRGRRA